MLFAQISILIKYGFNKCEQLNKRIPLIMLAMEIVSRFGVNSSALSRLNAFVRLAKKYLKICLIPL